MVMGNKAKLQLENDSKQNDTPKKFKSIFKNVLIYGTSMILAAALSSYGIQRAETKKPKEVISITNNDAEKYFYDGQYVKAIEEYEKLSKSEEENPVWPVKIAEIYSIQGNIESSNSFLKIAKDIRKKNNSSESTVKLLVENFEEKDIEAADYIIFTEYMNKNYKEALNYGEKVINTYKSNKKIMMTMIPVYMANDKIDEAKALIENYPIDSNSAYDLAKLAYLNILVDKWDDGLKILKTAWDKDKDEYKIFDVLAQISKYNKDMLLEKITLLSEKQPKEAAYKMWLSKIYSMREETAEMAQEFLTEATSAEVGSFMKVIIQARIYQNSGRTDEADALINKLIEEDQGDYRILHTASLFFYEKNQYDKALEYCKRSILQNKQYPDNYGFLMTDILKAMGKNNEGEPFFRTALYLEPFNYNIIHAIADYYWHTTKNSDKALEYFHFFEIVRPNDTEIKYDMAMIYTTNQKFDEAAAKLKKCIELDTAVPKYHRTLGTVYIQQGKYSQGIAEIRNAYQADKEDILTLNNAGCYYIMVESDVVRGRYNLEKAYEGLNDSVDEHTKETIKANYKKAEDIYEKYNSGKSNETITVPEFELFY